MNRITPERRLLTLILLATLTTLSGAIPILDLMRGDGRAAVEAKHHPGTHGFPHNHLICIQHQASHWVPGCQTPTPPLLATLELPLAPRANHLIRSGQILLPRARAPPNASTPRA